MKTLRQTLFSKRTAFICGASLLLNATSAMALTDLVKITEQAFISDPTFQQAKAQYAADVESMPQAISVVLPQISADGSYDFNNDYNHKDNQDAQPHGKQHYNSGEYSLDASQTLFDFGQFAQIAEAKSDVKSAVATLDAAQQDLIERVASAYFKILEAQDTLRYDIAQKRANHRQLDQAQQKYHVGVSAITDVYNAQANYDESVAQVIADKNEIQNAREDLRAITGVYYEDLAPLRERLPLVKPKPASVETWVKTAEKQNFSLQAARFNADAAQTDVNVQRSGHLPTLQANAERIHSYNGFDGTQSVNENATSVGITLSVPIFEGGLVLSQTREALAKFHVAQAQAEDTYRTTVNDTRQNYNDIISGISKINADRQFIRSAESSLKSNEESFKVGTRTIIDVLDSVTTLTQAQQQHAQDQYTYLLDTIALKKAAGTLSRADLLEINHWLIHSQTAAKKAAEPVDDNKLPEEEKKQTSKQKNKTASAKKNQQAKTTTTTTTTSSKPHI